MLSRHGGLHLERLTAAAAALAGTLILAPPADAQPLTNRFSLRVPGDFDRDGDVDTDDLMILVNVANSGQTGPAIVLYDLNRDGAVNAADIELFFGLLVGGTGTVPGADAGEPGGGGGFTPRLVTGNRLEIIDNASQFAVIRPSGTKLWSSGSGGANQAIVAPQIAMIPKPDGADIVYTFHNDTGQISGLGRFSLGGIRFAENIVSHDFRFEGKEFPLQSQNGQINIGGWWYPGGTYSPTLVFEDDPYVLGVSLLYPILDYKHQVRMKAKDKNSTGFHWEMEFALNPGDEEENKYSPEGELRPGETRVYIMAVRLARNTAEWTRTLQPYRDYFQSMYGGVDYERDARPVQFTALAVDGNLGWLNPYGFAGGDNLRPDHNGFGPWVDRLVTRVENGYARVMVSKTTGQFIANPQHNIPPLFASHWLEGDEYDHNMGDAIQQFNRIPDAGLNLTFWWGRSSQIIAGGWDTSEIQDFDPDNPEHVELALREFDLGVQAGARYFGLDAFRRMQVWDAVPWLLFLKDRHPGVNFVTEPMCGDIIHNMVPGFQVATRPLSEAHLRVETRHYLADFLNPGHEIWGQIRVDRLADYLGREPTTEDFQEEAARVAALGYIPCISENVPVLPSMVAVESWNADD